MNIAIHPLVSLFSLSSPCSKRRGWSAVAVGIFLAAAFLADGLLVGSAHAQQPATEEVRTEGGEVPPSDLHPLRKQRPQALRGDRRPSPRRLQQVQQGNQPFGPKQGAPTQSAVPASKNASDYEMKSPVQSWILADNPEPQLNFSVLGTPQRAGDVDGDGTNDYLYSDRARDERTSDLEDRTGKTALYFGGSDTPTEPDQLLYQNLTPVGDLNGDGFADALKIDSTSARIFTGSSSGYTDSEVTVSLSTDYESTVGFTDVDGDGFTDVLFHTRSSPNFDVINGADGLSNVSVTAFTPSDDPSWNYTYKSADLDDDGQTEIVQISGERFGANKQLRIYHTSDGSLVEEQSFFTEELANSFVSDFYFWLINIDGDGQREIAVLDRRDGILFAFDAGTDGTYDSTPVSFGENAPIPVGDLDDDGRHDFYTDGAIAFGPANLADGPVDPDSLADDVGGTFANLYASLGDLDGDGVDDTVLGYSGGTETSPTTGRSFVYGTSDRSSLSTTAVTYSSGRFYSLAYYTSNVGDLNGDGVDDIAVPFRVVGQTEIYFGGSSISQTPDLTLQTPYTSYLGPTIGGDFNNDGYSDIAAVYDDPARVEIFFGGSPMDATPDHTIDGTDFLANPEDTRFHFGANVGDVNDDGFDDLLFTEGYSASNENGDLEAFLFFGGSSLSSTPDQTITYGSTSFVSDDYAEQLGDVNGDGIDDFALTDPDRENDNGTGGAMYVYFGASGSPDFSSPDLTITPETPEDEGYTYFPVGVAAGDFNDDGDRDIAVKPQSVNQEFNDVSIHIYHGGSSLDAEADRRLDVPADPIGSDWDFNGSGSVNLNYGQLVTAPSSLGPDALLLTTAWTFSTNALLYQGDGTEPSTVLQAPNQTSGLGGISFANSGNAAVGDFTDDGDTDLVLTQSQDDNDGIFSSRVYRYTLEGGSPDVTLTSTDASATLEWGGTDGAEQYYIYRDAEMITGAPTNRTPIDSVDGTTTSYTDEPSVGGTYYYRVTAVDSSGSESGFSNEASAFLYPQAVSASVERSFGEAASSSDYRLVALPGQVSRPLGEAVSGEAGTAWQAYFDDGSDSDFLVEFDGSDTFTFETGNGFWLTATSTWTVEDSISAVELQGDSAATIPLQEGWNVISNPLDRDVDWASVQAANDGEVQALWGFEGAFDEPAETFASARTGKAYYFLNDNSDRSSLVIPYPGAPGGKAAPKADEEEVPMLALSAAAADGERSASTVQVGLSETRHVLVAPPGQFEATSLRIEAEETTSSRTSLLMAERRPIEGSGETFQLRLTSEAEGPVELTAENLDAVEGQSVALLHPSAGTSYDLRAKEAVTVEPGEGPAELTLAVGTEAYVESKRSDVVPEEVSLTTYPNPVRQQGTLAYGLPEEAEVTLRVYDVLGREVATLEQGRKKAGRHTVPLETDQLASGVYFGRLQAGGRTLTKKITVVR